MKFDRLGWFVAAALAGAMVASGFQTAGTKIGTVDIARFNESEFMKKQDESLQVMQRQRRDVLEYLRTYRAMKTDEAQRFRDLSLKANSTAADKDALEKLKQAIQADDAKFRNLQTKASPTPEETRQMQEYAQRAQALGALSQQWAEEFNQELGGLQAKLRQDAMDRVRLSVKDVAEKQGFSVVFWNDVAPYSANDLTNDAIKAMNARK